MKLIKTIFLFLIAAVSASAAEYDYTIVLSNPDHVEILDRIFDSITFFFDKDSGNIGSGYYNLLSFVVLLGVLFATTRLAISAMTGSALAGFKHYVIYLLSIVFVLTIIYGPKSNVLIQTKDSSQYATHEKIPQLFAYTISFFTKLRSELSDLSSMAFSIPSPTDNFKSGGSNGLGYVGMQTGLAEAFMSANFSKPNVDANIQPMYSRYLRDCVILPAVAQNNFSSITTLQKSATIKQSIDPANTHYGNEFISWDGYTGRCSAFWDGTVSAEANESNPTTGFGAGFVPLKTKITAFEASLGDANTSDGNISGGANYTSLASSLAYAGALMNHASAIANAASVKEATTQAVLSNEFKSTFSAMGVAGQVMADGAAQASADTQMNGISTGLYMSKMLPMFSFLVYALMIAAAPFMFAFALLPGSLGVMLNFLKTLMWVALWDPMANILGLFMDFYFAKNLHAKGYTTANEVLSMTPESLIDVSSDAAMIAGIAGGLYVAVQGLSWMLVTGSGQMLGNLMGGLASSFQNRANAEAQLATRTDMMETALISKEMGHAISAREKYAYSAMTQAASGAGAISGQMMAYGEGAGVANSLSHVTSNNAASSHGSMIGSARQLGTGAHAVEIGMKGGTLQSRTQVSMMDNMSMGNVLDAGDLAGTETSTATKSKVQTTKDHAKKNGNDWLTHASDASRKETLEATNRRLQKYSELTDPEVKDSSTIAGNTDAGTAKGSIKAVKEKYNEGIDASSAKFISATSENTAQDMRTNISRGENLKHITPEVKHILADKKADSMEKMEADGLKKFANEATGGNLKKAANVAVANAGTAMAGSLASQNQEIAAHHGAYVHDSSTLGFQKGADNHATAQVHQSHGHSGQEELADYNAEKNVEGAYKEMKVNKDRKANLQKELKSLKSKKSSLENEKKNVTNSAEATSKIQDEINDVKSDLDGVKQERENLAHEFRESFKNGKDHMSTKEFSQRSEALNQKEAALKGKLSDLSKERTHASRGRGGVENELSSVNSKIQSIQAELQQYDIANVGTAQGMKNMATLGTVAEATTHGGVQGAAVNMFNQGQMEMAGTNALMGGLAQMGATPHTIGTNNGMMKSMQMNGQMQGQIASAKAFISHADPSMVQAALQHMGIAGTPLADNPIAVAAALESFDTSRSFNADGSRTSFAVNASSGDIGYSSRDLSSSYDAGSHNRANLVDTGAMMGADISSGTASILVRHAEAEVANAGIEVAKRAAARKLTSGGGGGADEADTSVASPTGYGSFKTYPATKSSGGSSYQPINFSGSRSGGSAGREGSR